MGRQNNGIRTSKIDEKPNKSMVESAKMKRKEGLSVLIKTKREPTEGGGGGGRGRGGQDHKLTG